MVVILIACIGVFFDALMYFNEVWVDDGTYSHGYLSMLLVFYVIYCERNNLPTPRINISGIYTVLLLITVFAAYMANDLGQHFVYRCLFLIAALCIIRALFDKDESRFFIIPFLLLSLALPLWGLTLPPLQYISVLLVGMGINFTGLEVMIQGFYISIPNGTFQVADGCSGLRYLLVGATLVVFYWYMYFKSTKSFYKLLAFNILLGLITNWLRIGYLVYVGHASHMNDPLMTDHNMLGWYIFIVPVVLTFFYGRILENNELRNDTKLKIKYA